jgi:hypothetical protein
MSNNIIGGVTPLKARQSSRGGKRAGKATKTARRRGGFAKSKGKRGAGGRNVGGYNVQTRFQPRATEPTGGIDDIKLGGGGGGEKPVSFDKMGNMVFSPTINNYVNGGTGGGADANASANVDVNTTNQGEWVPPEYGYRTVEGRLPTYKESWDQNFVVKDGKRIGKYHTYTDDAAGYAEYEKAAKEYNRKHGTKGSGSYQERYLIKEGYFKQGTPNTTVNVNATANASTNPLNFLGKHKLGGYRAMHGIGSRISPWKENEESEESEENSGEESGEKKSNIFLDMLGGGLEAVYGKIGGSSKKKEEKKEEKNEEEVEAKEPGESLLDKLLGGIFKKKKNKEETEE